MTENNITQEPMLQIDPPAERPALPSPSDRMATPPAFEPPRRQGPGILRRILVFFLRLLLFLAVVAALVALVYFGWPVVYAQYIRPVQVNTTKVAALETHQQASQDQLAALQTQLPALAAEQAKLLDNQSMLMTAQAARIGTLESAVQERSQSLATAQAGLAASQMDLAAALTAQVPIRDHMATAVRGQGDDLAALQATQASFQAWGASARADVDRQMALLRGMELLSRARLFLYQSNFGLAKQDIQSARDLLAGLPDSNSAGGANTSAGGANTNAGGENTSAGGANAGSLPGASVREVVQRLDQALARLPEFPIAASGDLDIAWQLLLGGQALPGSSTPTPAPASDMTPTPAPTATVTPTKP